MTGEYNNPKDKLLDAGDRSNLQITMTWELWCLPHLEFLRAEWPRGAGAAMLLLFQAAAADERVVASCGGDVAKLTDGLKHFAPVCCFLGDEVVDRIKAEVVGGWAK